ncbi:hypothetical protein [Parapedobacter tibetensis]|uniref:hypothetical protein n=1 Tax=Parapedobacter tibetensis TaxID=2972951 RepID=UPI00214D2658|nr:hypothetical protein [Parapedobacter tibetensis]
MEITSFLPIIAIFISATVSFYFWERKRFISRKEDPLGCYKPHIEFNEGDPQFAEFFRSQYKLNSFQKETGIKTGGRLSRV